MHPCFSIHAPLSRRSGFTLIELLVVISIIALLIGILLPVLGTARYTANTLACATRLQQLGRAQATYQNDSDGYFAFNDRAPNNAWRTWDDRFAAGGYDGPAQPDLVNNPFFNDLPDEVGSRGDLYLCPLDTVPNAFAKHRRTYGVTELSINPTNNNINNFRAGVVGTRGPEWISVRIDDVVRSSSAISMTEYLRLVPSGDSQSMLGEINGTTVRSWDHEGPSGRASIAIFHHPKGPSNGPGVPALIPNQSYAPNYAFADSHVETLDSDETYVKQVPGPGNRGTLWDHTAGEN